MGEGVMTTAEAASYLRLTRKAVYRFIKCGDLPAVRIGRKVWRINRADLTELLHRPPVRRDR